jgi:BirA family biotin operon repressor/biotin-[acetyl-CoA-carboxylase] ligase
MNVELLQLRLAGLPIPEIQYSDVTGSTNEDALRWVERGAVDGCLVISDQQTQGRGRLRRRWITNPGAALAFSLILRPSDEEQNQFNFFSPLGALAICQALENRLQLEAQIKWPNDVLIQRKKVAGILVETAWLGSQLQGLVIGIGLNITPVALPPANEVLFPAICVEEAAGRPVDRLALLHDILQALFSWRAAIHQPLFRTAWEERLAFRGEWVKIEEASNLTGSSPTTGQIRGVDETGNLLLATESGKILQVAVGDLHLRLID